MPTDARFALVLGRLFKIHPEFIDTIAQLLVMLNNSNNNGIYYIVFVAEKIIDWNDAIYRQLKEAYKNINERQLLFHKTANAQPLKVRFIHLSLYRQLVVSATVVLDTFPYGGIISMFI